MKEAFLLLKIKMQMSDVFLIFILFLSLLKNRMKKDKIWLFFSDSDSDYTVMQACSLTKNKNFRKL